MGREGYPRYAGCDIIPRASRRAADRIFCRPAESLPFFSRANKGRLHAKLVQDFVCLPLTSTLLDKDNAPSLIRFGDNSFRSSSAQGKKSRGRSRFPGTSNRFFSLSLSLLFSNELFAKKWSNTFCATNFFLYAFPRDEETQSVGDAENTVKEGSERGEGKEGKE